MENNCHWNLDVIMDPDRLQCKNGEFLAGRIALNKIGLNFLTRIQAIFEEKGEFLTKEEIRCRLHSPEDMLAMLFSCVA